jgi:hypothetical protein
VNVRIRDLLAIRRQVTDQVLLDYLTLVILVPEPGVVTVEQLRKRWGCHQSNVSRRMQALAASGLASVSRGHGFYQVHGILPPEDWVWPGNLEHGHLHTASRHDRRGNHDHAGHQSAQR